ncbi:MAG: ABC transporter ATP-binding protein [Erysipelotrichaceae bacterium]|nr:ABC transporter ATP-binding protein [Erysipelotrichaceae bacterium]
MFRYFKNYKKELILAPLFKLMESFFDLLIPLVMASIIDEGIVSGNISFIIQRSLLIVGIGLVGFSCTVIAQYYAAKGSVGITCDLREDLFVQIQKLSFKELDGFSASSLISRLTNDTNTFQNGLNLAIRLLLRSPFIVFGALVMSFIISQNLSLIFLVTIIVLTVIVVTIALVTFPMYGKVQGRLDEVLSIIKDDLSGVRILRAFRKERSEIDHFENRNEELYTEQKKVTDIANILNPLTYGLVNIAIVLIIYYGSFEINNGLLLNGKLIALYNYLSQILIELIKLVNLIIVITKAMASFGRIDEVINTESSLLIEKNPEKETDSVIVFDHVNFRYPEGSADALEDLNFEIRRNERIGIIGPTGCGKSSIVQLLNRFYDVSSGNIYINGKNIRDYELDKLRDNISTIFQRQNLLSGTVRSNLLSAKVDASEGEMFEAIRDAQADDFINDLDREVRQGGTNFSGGQNQRLTIAQALLKKSDILIVDDATSALDYKTEREVKEKLIKPDMTTLIISQRINNIKECDRIMVMDDGKIVDFDTHEKLMDNCQTYIDMYNSQVKKEEN